MDNNTLESLLNFSLQLTANRSLDPLLETAMRLAIKLAQAEKGFLVLIGEEGQLEYRVRLDHQGRMLENPDGEVSHSILHKVIESKRSRLISDANIDPDFHQEDSVVSLCLRSVVCVPLIYDQESLGAIYLENRTDVGVFEQNDLEPLELFANQAGFSIHNALMNDVLEKKALDHAREIDRLNKNLLREVAERRLVQQQLRQLSITDPLTRVYNRRHFFELAEMEMSRSKRYSHPISIIMLDLDNFKQVNDTHGHVVGDQMLMAVANLCMGLIRENDFFARYGGEEFIVLLPEAGLASAREAAERLVATIEKTSFVTNAGDLSITISAGVSSNDGQADILLEKLIDRADQALYRAKRAGRNRVMV